MQHKSYSIIAQIDLIFDSKKKFQYLTLKKGVLCFITMSKSLTIIFKYQVVTIDYYTFSNFYDLNK